jgi:hypothetical protein
VFAGLQVVGGGYLEHRARLRRALPLSTHCFEGLHRWRL